MPIKLKESEKYNFSCIDSEGAHFTTDKDEMTVSGSNVEHATDLDEDFSMNSSSTMPNISEVNSWIHMLFFYSSYLIIIIC